jgi:parallel beta-helix repeat protein
MNLRLPLFAALMFLLAPAARAATFYVSLSGSDAAVGTAAAPVRTIQHGVDTLKPGDTLIVEPGIYREDVAVMRGGTAGAPISIEALPGGHVIVSGADRLADGWTRVPGAEDGVYAHAWPYRFPIGGPNELTHPNDEEHRLTGRAEQVIHGGRLLRQVLSRDRLARGTFFADLNAKRLYVWLRGSDDPSHTEVEASVRSTWLTASAPVSYVHVRGITFRYAANHAQRGAFALGQGARAEAGDVARGWRVDDCIFERANGPGASLSGEDHIFRRCVFQDNGQLGFGTSRCDRTRMEQCGIYRNNTKGYSTGWEAGGLKVTMSRGFVFDGCRAVDNRGVGIWFDIGNEQSEVKNCYIADNDEAGIFYEISYGLHAHDNLIVNNANNGEAVGGAWGEGGITLSSSEDCVIDHNTLVGNRDGIAFREQDRTTPRIGAPPGAKEVRILNRNHVIRDNLVACSQNFNIAMWMDTTFFGPHPSGGDKNRPVFEDPKTLNIRFANNLLWALPGRPNYLYGVPWRSRSKQSATAAEFTAASGIPDTSRAADPRFADITAGDFHLLPGSPALKMGAGRREQSPQLSRNRVAPRIYGIGRKTWRR